MAISKFQSTHPVRGATIFQHLMGLGTDISIHAPREGCDSMDDLMGLPKQISIHAPREGCDESRTGNKHKQSDFNPRTP